MFWTWAKNWAGLICCFGCLEGTCNYTRTTLIWPGLHRVYSEVELPHCQRWFSRKHTLAWVRTGVEAGRFQQQVQHFGQEAQPEIVNTVSSKYLFIDPCLFSLWIPWCLMFLRWVQRSWDTDAIWSTWVGVDPILRGIFAERTVTFDGLPWYITKVHNAGSLFTTSIYGVVCPLLSLLFPTLGGPVVKWISFDAQLILYIRGVTRTSMPN